MRTAAVFSVLPRLASLLTSPLTSLPTSLLACLVGRRLALDSDPELLFRCNGGGGSHLAVSRELDRLKSLSSFLSTGANDSADEQCDKSSVPYSSLSVSPSWIQLVCFSMLVLFSFPPTPTP